MAPCSRRALRVILLTAGGLIAAAALLLCFGPGSGGPSPQRISPPEALELLSGQESVLFLDVRTQAEYDQGHLEGAVLIPGTELSHRVLAELPDKGALIILYCRSGNRSATAAKELADLGYTQVYDLGGIIDWPYGLVS